MLILILSSVAALQLSPGPPPQPAPKEDGEGMTAAQASGGGPEAEQLLPGMKRCPDGSILRTIDRCAEMPDHRFEITHEPERQMLTRRWWCRESRQASEISVTLELRQPAPPAASLRHMSRLDALVVSGYPTSSTLKRSVQKQMGSFHRLDSFGGRCLFVRPGETIPVLTLHGVSMSQGKLSWKHVEIRLDGYLSSEAPSDGE